MGKSDFYSDFFPGSACIFFFIKETKQFTLHLKTTILELDCEISTRIDSRYDASGADMTPPAPIWCFRHRYDTSGAINQKLGSGAQWARMGTKSGGQRQASAIMLICLWAMSGGGKTPCKGKKTPNFIFLVKNKKINLWPKAGGWLFEVCFSAN